MAATAARFIKIVGTTIFTGALTIGGSGFANSAVNGGGISNANGTLTLPSSASITFNTATGNGGGINNGGTINSFSGAAISNNSATTSGGGIFNGGTITVSGATLNSNSATTGSSITQSAGTFNSAGTNTLSGNLAITGGTFNAGSSTVNLAGNFSFTGGTFTQGTSTFNFNGATAQSIAASSAITFNHLSDANVTQPLAINNSINVNGSLTANGANTILSPVAAAVIGGTGTLTGTGTARVTRATGTNDFFTQYAMPNRTLTNLTIDYVGAAAQGVSAATYSNLRINNGSGASLSGNVTVNATLTLIAGQLSIGTNTLTLDGAWNTPGGTFTSAATGTVNYNQSSHGQVVLSGNYGNLIFSNFNKDLTNATIGIAGAFTPGSGTATTTNSTITFNGTSAQTIPAFNYNHLTLSNAAGANLGGNVVVPGTLTLTSGNLGVGANTLTLNGVATATGGTLSSGATGTVNYNQGSDGQVVLAANYGNLTFSNFNKDVSNKTIGIAGTFTPGSGTHTITGSTFVYNGTSAQTLPAGFATYNNLTLNNPAGTTGFAGLTVQSLLRVQAGTFTSSSTYTNVQIDSGATLAASAGSTINVSGSWTNNGTFTPNNGTVVFNGAVTQTIGGTSASTFHNLTNSNPTGLTFDQNGTVNGILALTSGDITVANTKTLTQPSTGSSSGAFDVIGSVKRTGFVLGTPLSFGNQFNTIAINSGALPADINVNLVKSTPVGFAGSVQRTYTITPNGAHGPATLRLHYLQSELNGNTEASLNLRRFNGTGWAPYPATAADQNDNWVENDAVQTFSPWTLSSFTPTASNGTVSGRITASDGTPVAGAVVRLSGTQNRKFITDANGVYRFEQVETGGFYTVTPSRANYTFSPASRSFSQTGATTEAAFDSTVTSSALANPLDTPEYFVRQNYLDFLGREPDEAGFNFWSDEILSCGENPGDTDCVDRKRTNVSAAYFLSIEFQETGGLVDGLYRASFGRRPGYGEFKPDAAAVAPGLMVGRDGWQTALENGKAAFIDAFVNRAAFQSVYGGLSNDAYVDALIANTGITFTSGERSALVNGLAGGGMTRAAALRAVVENPRAVAAKRNEAFVMMEYFGYLRREPDAPGFDYWLNKLTEFNGNFEQAEMVRSFIVSQEYRDRFQR